jgi:hypothetical protein
MTTFSNLPIRQAGSADAAWVIDFQRERWNATMTAAHDESIDASTLPALIGGNYQGLATCGLLGRDAELITLDATPANTGTGTAIIDALVARLRAGGCKRLWITTTDDNLSALRFYLRRDFRLMQECPGAVDAARKLKPTIPLIGEHGIPMREEIDLCRVLDSSALETFPAPPPWSRVGRPSHD